MTHHGNTTSDRMERARRRHMRWVASRRITCHGEIAKQLPSHDGWGIWIFCGECQHVSRIH